MKLTPIILAGGGGTRLWPMSREHYPKQFINLAGKNSLLQQTLCRLDGFELARASGVTEDAFEIADPVIVCNEEHRFLVAEHARTIGKTLGRIVLEPAGRNTAPALTAAILLDAQDDEDSVILMMPADHIINEGAAFRRAVEKGYELANAGYLITFGIVPKAAESGYGYIRLGESVSKKAIACNDGIHVLDAFIEKPDVVTAQYYLDAGNYVWNSGIFMMRASVWRKAIEEHRPDIEQACARAVGEGISDGEFFRLGKEAFQACPAESVDYAVMEKITGEGELKAAVVSLDAGWSDVGSWASLWQNASRDNSGNLVRGDICTIDSAQNVIMAEHRLVAALGCENMVIIETADAVMVAPKERAQDVKRIVEWLSTRNRTERLVHRRVYRPWGNYEGVDSGDRFQVKRITVKPGAKLSLQMHHHRAEHWIVVKGTARVVRGDDEFLLTENESTYIPLGTRHRLENPGTIPLELVEVQSGSYLGEDDIIRFQDDYKRQ